jgi:hypothetical protein
MKNRFNIKTQAQLDNFLRLFANTDIPETGLVVEVTEFKNNRSLAQNRYLWDQVYTPVAVQISEATNTLVKKDHIHKFFQDRFAPRDIVNVMGETICTPRSTTKFTKAEMSEYIEKCHAWGAEHGVWFN